MHEKRIKLASMDAKKVSMEIEDFILKQTLAGGWAGGVIGLSGGLDSTVSALLANYAYSRHNQSFTPELELVGYILPSSTNSPIDTEDGIKVAEELGIRYEILSIEPIVEAFRHTNPDAFDSKYHKGNLMSRIRANVLHTKSSVEKKLVIGTGNWNEDFVLGYYTLFGDGAVHISPIGNLPKRLVCEIANYNGFEKQACRVPTAGLEPGQTDFKDLGYSYDTAEIVARGFIQNFSIDYMANHPQVTQTAKKDITNYRQAFGEYKFRTSEEIIRDIAKRKTGAEKKACLLSPKAAQVTLEYK